ncbi:hypothetical protein [Rhodococcus sp. 14-2470-1a]|uniref:hypothetical protein n=1 Tax=Rhodococcus sp. 14-2470-1a TaxID=2023150 RepID=UPI000B9C080B|nr:hypothetical protein [Rhodococcus sp. 14-2470-1a]OZF41905.1 hypothetical protein CH292_27245 [Rhodococcus sp. 14-2470-1a]
MADDETVAERALRMRKSGSSWQTIEESTNMPAALLAELVADLLLGSPELSRDIEVRLDLARLDELLVPVWRYAKKGDPKSVDQAMKILNRRHELLSELGSAGAALDPPADVDGDDGPAPDDRPAAPVTPADYLARVRRAAAGATAPALHLVEDDDEDDDI